MGETLYEDLTNQANQLLLRCFESRAIGLTDEADRLQAQVDEVLSFRDQLPIKEAY